MIKRLAAFILTMVMLLSSFSSTTFACDENQTNTYIAQMLFGDSAVTRSSDEKTIMLFNALYLCSEQTGGQGQDKIDYLKSHRVFDVPALTKLTIKADDLLDCSHNTWEHEFTSAKKNQSNRRKVLRNTVNKVFDFGMINNLFNSSSYFVILHILGSHMLLLTGMFRHSQQSKRRIRHLLHIIVSWIGSVVQGLHLGILVLI